MRFTCHTPALCKLGGLTKRSSSGLDIRNVRGIYTLPGPTLDPKCTSQGAFFKIAPQPHLLLQYH